MKIKKASLYIVNVTVFLLIGCAGTIQTPVPIQQRVKCVIVGLEDLTGSYDKVSPNFETIFNSKLMQDFAQRIKRGPTPSYYSRFKIQNMFIPLHVSPRMDTIIEKGEVDPTINYSNAGLVLKGTVEQLSYGSPEEIEKYLGTFALFGMLGVAITRANNEETRAGFVEYRFNVYRLPNEEFLDSFTVQGAYKSSISGRQEIIEKANEIAAEELIFKLNKRISNQFGKQSILIEYHSP